MSPVLDVLVLTAANEAQAKGYRRELAARRSLGALGGVGATIVVADPRGRRAGSGGSTIWCLLKVATRFGARGLGDIERVLQNRRIAIIHCGGDSRRLPAFSAHGKVFAPMPSTRAEGDTVFDRVVADLLAVVPRSGQILVAAGDVMLGLAEAPTDLHAGDITVAAQRVPFAQAAKHGVFVVRDGRVVHALQKPTREAARVARAVDGRGRVLIDTGLMALSARAAARLVKSVGAHGVRALAAGTATATDLYDHVMRACLAQISAEEFARPYQEVHAWRPEWAGMRRALRGTRVGAVVIGGQFRHAGTTREYLSLLARTSGNRLTRINSVGALVAPRGRVAMVDCGMDRAEVCGDALIVGLGRLGARIALPPAWCAFELPLTGGRAVRVVHGIDDDFKTTVADDGTMGGVPIDEWLADHGVQASLVFSGDPATSSLWDARLWPVIERPVGRSGMRELSAPMHRLLGWMMSPGARPTAAWHGAKRVTARELAASADGAALVAWHDARVTDALAESLAERVARVSSTSPLATHERITSAGSALALAEAYEARAREASQPLDRARLQMALADVARRHLPAVHAVTDLRALALASVGDAVSQSIPYPVHAARAAIRQGQTVHAHAPVRVDLAGGWSDTPPICNEVGGAVLNAAILLSGTHPIKVVARLSHEPVISIHSVDQGARVTIMDARSALDFSDPRQWHALPKAALVLSGIVPRDPALPLRRTLERFGGGIELTVFSGVPKGSGLGTSSIFGATMLAALAALIGERGAVCANGTPTNEAVDRLIQRTSVLEQLIGTRGGWQDQVGGLVGGFKYSTTPPGKAQRPRVERLAIPAAARAPLQDRCVLLYSGMQRMAKDILETVIGAWLLRDPLRVNAVGEVKLGAHAMRQALVHGDVDEFARLLKQYWHLKVQLDPASTNPKVEALLQPHARDLSAWSLAGAGGGGFALLVARDIRSAAAIRARVARTAARSGATVVPFEFTDTGIGVSVL